MEASEWFKKKNKESDFSIWFDYTYDKFGSFRRFPKSVLEDMAKRSWSRCNQLHANMLRAHRKTIKDAINSVDSEELKTRLKKLLGITKYE